MIETIMQHLQDFHFLRPYWLLALIPLLIMVIALRKHLRQQSGWQSVLASHLYTHLLTEQGDKGKKPPLLLLGLGWLISVLAIAGPTWERLPQPVYQLHSGKVIMLDMSMSMRATDLSPDRLTRAKFKAIDLVKAMGEGEIGLIAYAGDAFTISPLTSDGQNLSALIPSLSPEIMPVAGSDPYLGLSSAIELLENAGYTQGEIFWLTDGIEARQSKEVSDLIAKMPYRLSVLAIGTEKGAPIKLATGEFLKDSRGAIVLPKLESAPLAALAKKGKGRFVGMQADDSDIEYLTEQTLLTQSSDASNEAADKQSEQRFGDEWQEAGPYLVLLLLPFAAYAFRRGLISMIALAMLLPLTPKPAHADWWSDLWQNKNQQGQQAFSAEDYASAAEQFNDPNWQGASHYRNGDYQAALDAYSADDSAQGWYNRGNALAQLGKLDEAIAAYDEVLSQHPEHQDALANKALLEQLKQQQEQQQSDQNQDNQNSDQQNKDQQQGDQQENNQSQNDSQQNESQSQQGADQQDNQQNKQEGQNNPSEQNPPNSDSEADEQNPSQQEQGEAGEPESSENEQTDGQTEQPAQEDKEEQQNEQRQAQAQANGESLSDEEKERMQRMQNLLRRIPDDPAFLLKRKMQLEHQARKRERKPQQQSW